eukprot:TRINITY_DN5949_c0_g2_i1.p1 TRINITY_DN5949_c0_g2~~TRINITY_DN5949_c0_g2_i1.p1  ORF type:complete len:1967 (+),score=324.40 TRINITY_DN5949_c0_g2_i1:685-6585(+)
MRLLHKLLLPYGVLQMQCPKGGRAAWEPAGAVTGSPEVPGIHSVSAAANATIVTDATAATLLHAADVSDAANAMERQESIQARRPMGRLQGAAERWQQGHGEDLRGHHGRPSGQGPGHGVGQETECEELCTRRPDSKRPRRYGPHREEPEGRLGWPSQAAHGAATHQLPPQNGGEFNRDSQEGGRRGEEGCRQGRGDLGGEGGGSEEHAGATQGAKGGGIKSCSSSCCGERPCLSCLISHWAKFSADGFGQVAGPEDQCAGDTASAADDDDAEWSSAANGREDDASRREISRPTCSSGGSQDGCSERRRGGEGESCCEGERSPRDRCQGERSPGAGGQGAGCARRTSQANPGSGSGWHSGDQHWFGQRRRTRCQGQGSQADPDCGGVASQDAEDGMTWNRSEWPASGDYEDKRIHFSDDTITYNIESSWPDPKWRSYNDDTMEADWDGHPLRLQCMDECTIPPDGPPWRGAYRLYDQIHELPTKLNRPARRFVANCCPARPHHYAAMDYLAIYTDGTANDERTEAAWAFVVIGHQMRAGRRPMKYMCGFYGGEVPSHLEQTSLNGELWAIINAMAWLKMFRHANAESDRRAATLRAHFFVDNIAAMNVGDLTSGLPESSESAAVLGHIARTMKPGSTKFSHVKSHSGIGGNELVDKIALAARENKGYFIIQNKHVEFMLHDKDIKHRYLTSCYTNRGEEYPADWDDVQKPKLAIDTADIAEEHRRCTTISVPRKRDKAFNLKLITANVKSGIDKKDGKVITAGLNASKRAEHLDYQFRREGVHIAGLQETRSAGPSSRVKKSGQNGATYHVHTSGCCSKGGAKNFGIEIWIARTMSDGESSFDIKPNASRILHAEPRMLLISLTSAVIDADIVAIHAPCRQEAATIIESFWDDIMIKILAKKRAHVPLIMLGDMNATLPTHEQVTGRLASGDADGHPATQCMQQLGLHVPATYAQCSPEGLAPTHYSHNGLPQVLDYIAISTAYGLGQCRARVNTDIDLTIASVDHMAVELTIMLMPKPISITNDRRQLSFDIKKATLPEAKQKIKNLCEGMYKIQWDVEPTTHYYMFTTGLQAALEAEFPARKRRPTPPWMSTETEELLRQKAQCFRRAVNQKRKGQTDEATMAAHKDVARRLKQRVLADKAQYADGLLAQIADDFDHSKLREAYSGMKAMRPYKPPPPALLQDDEGRPAQTTAQAADMYLEHWCRTLGAEKTTFQELADEHMLRWEAAEESGTKIAFPTEDEIANAIKNTKPRAWGDDRVPMAVMRQAPKEFAKALHPLFCKTILYQHEPFAWTGDTRVMLPKPKQASHTLASMRGVALMSGPAKLLHKLARKPVAAKMSDELPKTVSGALAKRGTEMAILTQLQFVERCRRRRRSGAVLFIDLSQAFDIIRRDSVMPALPDHERSAIINTAHQHGWTTAANSDVPIKTVKGVRQGDPCSDLAFVAAIEKTMEKARSTLRSENMTVDMKHVPDDSIYGPVDKSTLTDVSYIDDIGAFVDADNANDLIDKLRFTTQTIVGCLSADGHKINFKKGKTEATAFFAGQGATKAKRAMFDDNYKVALNDHSLSIVAKYNHLGVPHSFMDTAGVIIHNACCTLAYSIGEMSRAVLSNKHLSEAARRRMVALILSKALYAAPTWPAISAGHTTKLRGAYNKVIRAATKTTWCKSHNPIREEELRKIGYSTITTHLRTRRLLFAPRVFKNGSPQLLALLHENAKLAEAGKGSGASWHEQLLADLTWLWNASTKVRDMPDPRRDVGAWKDLMVGHQQQWANIVKANATSVVGTEWDKDPEGEEADEDGYFCGKCCEWFKDVIGLHKHNATRHGRIPVAKSYAKEDNKCWWCEKKFPTRGRLIQHMRQGWLRKHNTSCIAQIGLNNMKQLDIGEVRRIDAIEKARCAGMRKAGRHPNNVDAPTIDPDEPEDKPIMQGPMQKHFYTNEMVYEEEPEAAYGAGDSAGWYIVDDDYG